MYARSVHNHIAIQEMSAVVILVSLKTVRFSCKDKSENTFIKYVMARELLPRHHKNNKFFANDNTPWGLDWESEAVLNFIK